MCDGVFLHRGHHGDHGIKAQGKIRERRKRTNAMQKTLKHKAIDINVNLKPFGYSVSSSDSSPDEAASGATSLLSDD